MVPLMNQPNLTGPSVGVNHGMPPHSQAGIPPQPDINSEGSQQPQQMFGRPPSAPGQAPFLQNHVQPGFPSNPQAGMPPQPGQLGMNSETPNHQSMYGRPSGPSPTPPLQNHIQPGLPPQTGLPPHPGIPSKMPQLQQQPVNGLSSVPARSPADSNHMPSGMPPHSQASLPPQPGQPPVGQNHVQPGMPSHPQMSLPPQPGLPPSNPDLYGRPQAPQQQSQNHIPSGLPPSSQAGMPPMAGQQAPKSDIPQQMYGRPPVPQQSATQNHVQPGMPPHSQASVPSMPGMPPHSQASLPSMPQPGMPPHSQGSMPSMPGQPGMPPHSQANMPSMPGQPGMPPHSQANMPSMPGQPGMPPHSQASMPSMPGQPGMPPMPPHSQTNLPGQPGMNSDVSQQHQQSMYGRPLGPPGPGAVNQNHVQPGMPPAAAPGSQLPKRYPAYPQQQPGAAPAQTYPSYPQPGMGIPQQGIPQQQPVDGGFYPVAGVNAGPQPQFQRPPGPGALPQGTQTQPNYPQYGQPPPGQYPAPGGQYPAPGGQYPAPGGQYAAPGAQYPAPAGQYPAPGGAPSYPQPSATQQGQKRLDPDQMPSAIGVMQEDQQGRGGIFRTDQKGLLPPLVTTKFQVEDFGNSSPRFIRSTMYSVPAQPDMLKQTGIPFALVINPFESPAKDEQAIPCVDLGPMGPVRCIRCKAYMSPLMQFIDGGRRFQCLLCKATTEVPPEYFQHLDHTGQRVDKWERPELWRGTYEYIATAEYCRNTVLPKEPAFIFVIDVSYNNIKSGLVNLLCSQMRNLLEALPSHTPVGFITYNSKVHFYNIDPALAQPQMVVVPDVADMFMPLLRGFLVPCAEAMNSVDMLMEQIPALFNETKETEAVLGPAVVAGMEALKASDRVGKLLLFHSSLPVSEVAPGKLKNREADRRLLGTDKEKTVLVPQSTYYNSLGQECVGAGVSVDLYLFNNSYIDVATIGQVARLTGGSVNKYTYFQADIDGPRVVGDLILHLGRPVGFDSVMRVRTSTGVRPTDFFGHYFMANTTDVELAAVDSQKGIAVEIKHDASITEEDGVYIQVALLYTTIYGQRRLRVHNLALNTCMQMADLYRNCELDTIINFMAKQSISKSVETTPQDLKEGVIKRCAQMLATYRKHCANPSMPGQLILPECLKLLPLYINCVLRSDAVAGTSEITPDDRSWLMYTTMTMGVTSSVHYFYPQLVPVAGLKGSIDDPVPVRCSRDKLTDDSAFILENGIYIFLWIGAAVSPDWLRGIFGVTNLGQINVETITELPDNDVNSDESLRLRALIRSLRNERQRHMRLTIVRQRDKMELVMNRFLVEDRGTDGQPSYVDFLCHMHKEIRSLLNQ